MQPPWKPSVFTYEEMEQLLQEENGDIFTTHMNEFKEKLSTNTSFRYAHVCGKSRRGSLEMDEG